MTIRKGEQWGIEIVAPSSLILLKDDRQLASIKKSDVGVLMAGDIHQALGSPMPVQPGALCTQLEIDAMLVEIQTATFDDVSQLASSCVEIGTFRPSFIHRRRYVCITNGGLVHGRNLAPRAHPNDGVLDSVTLSSAMTFRDRLSAQKKALTGTHLPHPEILVSRGESFSYLRTNKSEHLSIDGQRVMDWVSVRVTVQPDYWKIVV
jgi:hypothetical protein